MTKHLFARLTLVSALATLLATSTLLSAAEADKPAKEKKAAAQKEATTKKSTNYRGTVSAVDATALTLTITNKSSSRVLHVTSETRFFKKEKPATLGEMMVGDAVGGSYATSGETLNALTVRSNGPDEKPAKKEAKAEKKAEKKAEAKPADAK
jgi:hypothetical protein